MCGMERTGGHVMGRTDLKHGNKGTRYAAKGNSALEPETRGKPSQRQCLGRWQVYSGVKPETRGKGREIS